MSAGIRVRTWRRARFALLASAALLCLRCADNDAVAPFLDSGIAGVELRLTEANSVARALPPQAPASAETATMAPCDLPGGGFPEDVRLVLVINPPSGAGQAETIDIPAGSDPPLIEVGGLAPDSGYRIEATVSLNTGEHIFEGRSAPFNVLPGVMIEVPVDLEPPFGRRAVLALGGPTVAGNDVTVPVFVSNSRSLRGVEFDLCFDASVLEPLGAQAVGTRAEAFRGAGGQPAEEGIYRAVLWSPDAGARLVPGRDQVLEIGFRFRSAFPGSASNLVFLNTLVTDSPDSTVFTTYVFDGRVQQ